MVLGYATSYNYDSNWTSYFNIKQIEMKTATEFWQEKFGEEPKSDNDKLMCAMMAEYCSRVCSLYCARLTEENEDLKV